MIWYKYYKKHEKDGGDAWISDRWSGSEGGTRIDNLGCDYVSSERLGRIRIDYGSIGRDEVAVVKLQVAHYVLRPHWEYEHPVFFVIPFLSLHVCN